MKIRSSFLVLRLGLAITFVWIGVLIILAPDLWGGYIQEWALRFIPGNIHDVMISAAIVDIIAGIFLLHSRTAFYAAIVASVHIVIILITVGINDFTVRDIGILGGLLSVIIGTPWPKWVCKACKISSQN